jgi:hypothetical protein
MDQTYRVMRFWFDGLGNVPDRLMAIGELVAGLDPSLYTPPPSTSIEVGPQITEIYTSSAGQTSFPVQYPFVPGTTEVYLDGVRMALGVGFDYVETGQAVLFDEVVNDGQRVLISYQPEP